MNNRGIQSHLYIEATVIFGSINTNQ